MIALSAGGGWGVGGASESVRSNKTALFAVPAFCHSASLPLPLPLAAIAELFSGEVYNYATCKM